MARSRRFVAPESAKVSRPCVICNRQVRRNEYLPGAAWAMHNNYDEPAPPNVYSWVCNYCQGDILVVATLGTRKPGEPYSGSGHHLWTMLERIGFRPMIENMGDVPFLRELLSQIRAERRAEKEARP